MQAEIGKGEDGAETVDVPGGFKTSQQPRDHLGPGGVGELQGHAGEGEAEETRDHHQVQVAVERANWRCEPMWHLPQVLTMLARRRRGRGSVTGRMSWEPWQS